MVPTAVGNMNSVASSNLVVDVDDSLINDSKNVIYKLVREVHYLRNTVESLKGSSERDTKTILTLREDNTSINADNRILTAELQLLKKQLATSESRVKTLELENQKLKKDLDGCSYERHITLEKLHALSGSTSTAESLVWSMNEETTKYVSYISCLEAKISALSRQNRYLKEGQITSKAADAKFRAAARSINELLQHIALEGLNIVVQPQHLPLIDEGDQGPSWTHMDCHLSMLRSTVESLIQTLRRSQQNVATMRNTVRLYEESTAFLDAQKGPINSNHRSPS